MLIKFIIMLAILIECPVEYSRWLIKHGKEVQARKVLQYVYNDKEEVDNTMLSIKEQTLNTKSFLELIKFITQWKVFQR